MNMKDKLNQVMETLKTTVDKTAATFSVLENNLKNLTQKIKADLQKAKEAKTSETAPPPPTSATQTTNEKTTTEKQHSTKEEGKKPQQ